MPFSSKCHYSTIAQKHPLTLIFKEQNLHAVKGEGLPEAVRHRVLLFLEDFSHLKKTKQKWLRLLH